MKKHYFEKSIGELMEECGFIRQNKLMKNMAKVDTTVTYEHKTLTWPEVKEEKIRFNSK